MPNQDRLFALCVDNTDYEASLIFMKVYEVLTDDKAAEDDFLRIIDESGEDYLFHNSHFVLIDLPTKAEQLLVTA